MPGGGGHERVRLENGSVRREGHGFKNVGLGVQVCGDSGARRGGGAVVRGHESRGKNYRYPQCVLSDE